MKHRLNQSPNGDTLLFAEESNDIVVPDKAGDLFKLLIVDDENEIHVMTKLVLKDYQYMGKGLEFISAFSGKEAKEKIQAHDDIACCLLDVVMESKNAGLDVARYIREDAGNTKIRIVLRTGQPGKAPEKDIILGYDINDYKEKTELTTQKLFTTITTALRSYMHLIELEEKNQEIKSKNIRLNEEIARRIVAESNLTKYNRSLERMIESKTTRLEEALKTIEETEKQLFITQKAAIVSDLSSVSLDSLDSSNTLVGDNLKKMNLYRQQMTFLLEKYNTLEAIIASHKGTRLELEKAAGSNLTEIKAYKTKIDFEDMLERYPKIIEDSLEGISQISNAINDIKLFVSINDEDKTSVDINHLVRQITDDLKTENRMVDIQLDLADLPVIALPDKNFSKALREILENACFAVENRGIVSVATCYEDGQAKLVISDIGTGIEPESLARIFIPYFKAWEKGGKGLGLSFAKSVLLNCGGDIKVTSTVNEGTTATLCLPC